MAASVCSGLTGEKRMNSGRRDASLRTPCSRRTKINPPETQVEERFSALAQHSETDTGCDGVRKPWTVSGSLKKFGGAGVFTGLKFRPGAGNMLKFLGFAGKDDLLGFLNPN